VLSHIHITFAVENVLLLTYVLVADLSQHSSLSCLHNRNIYLKKTSAFVSNVYISMKLQNTINVLK